MDLQMSDNRDDKLLKKIAIVVKQLREDIGKTKKKFIMIFTQVE